MPRLQLATRLGSIFTAAVAFAALDAAASDPSDKELFGQSGVLSPFTLTIERANRYMEITGIADSGDGSIWVTGYLQDRDRSTGAGYLASIGHDGTIRSEYEIALPDVAVTQFWWPAPLDDGNVAVATALDPFTESQNGAVLIVAPDGRVVDQILLTELGLGGGEVVHVETYPDGDLAITGSATLAARINGAMTARLRADLSLAWIATDRARDADHTLAGYASAILPDGSVVAIGSATDTAFAHGYGWLARFDADGRPLWRHWLTGGMLDLLGDASQIYGNWVDLLPDGNITYLQTSYDEWGDPVTNMLIRRTPVGRIVTQVPLVLVQPVDLLAMEVAGNGDVIVGGHVGPGEAPIVARVGPSGTLLWRNRLDDLPGGFVWGMIEAGDGSIIAVGTFFPAGNDIGAGWVARLRSDGSRL
ncbi:MAG: hypothetical protein ACFCVH_13245 [Alphaproteobacteria bacterium]